MGRTKPAVTFEEWALLAEIRAEKARRRWSRARMSEESGIPESSVRNYFEAADHSPPPSVLFAAARALGFRLSDLVERAEAVAERRSPADVKQWQEDTAPPARDLSEHVTRQLGPEAQEQVRKAKATRTKRTRQAPPNGQ